VNATAYCHTNLTFQHYLILREYVHTLVLVVVFLVKIRGGVLPFHTLIPYTLCPTCFGTPLSFTLSAISPALSAMMRRICTIREARLVVYVVHNQPNKTAFQFDVVVAALVATA
jgi:hypothetical protein